MNQPTTSHKGPAYQFLLSDIAEMIATIDDTAVGQPYFSHTCFADYCTATATFFLDSGRMCAVVRQHDMDQPHVRVEMHTAASWTRQEEIATAAFPNDTLGSLAAAFVAAILNQYTAERDLQ